VLTLLCERLSALDVDNRQGLRRVDALRKPFAFMKLMKWMVFNRQLMPTMAKDRNEQKKYFGKELKSEEATKTKIFIFCLESSPK
jgi:hypothetical protein